MAREMADRLNIRYDFAMEMIRTYEAIIYDVLECGEEILFMDFLMFNIVTRPALRKYNFPLKATVALPPTYLLKIEPSDKLAKIVSDQKVSAYEQKKYGLKDDD